MIACIISAIENENDREFMKRLYLNYYSLMYKKARSILPSGYDAEDAVESAILRLIDRIEALKNCSKVSLRAYLLSCARNAAIDQLRRRKKDYSFDDVNEQLERISDDTPVDSALIRTEQIQSVVRALKTLPDRERELLKMKYFNEMNDQEIADLLGISRDNLRTRLNRARRKLVASISEVENNG